MLKAGTILGNYEIIAPIGAGGMGVVYRARHTLLSSEVAFKELASNFTVSEKVRARFRQEAYLQANLKHPNIVHVTDMVMHEDVLGIVMDLVEGPSLEEVLEHERTGPWSLDEAMALMEPTLEGVAYAHEQGVVHRDLKPGNILLDRTFGDADLGMPKVADFGIAKILSSEVAMTRTGARMGTVPYMAPEQFSGKKDISARADVFALAMILWRLLTGRLPVEPDDLMGAAELYSGRSPVQTLAEAVPDTPKAISDAVELSLSTSVANRPRDATVLLGLLSRVALQSRLATGHSVQAKQEPQPTEAAAPTTLEHFGPIGAVGPPKAHTPRDSGRAALSIRRLSWLIPVVVVGAILLVVLVGRDNSDDSEQQIEATGLESNLCGGTGPLQGLPGEACGPCGHGSWGCAGSESVSCAGAIGCRVGEPCSDDSACQSGWCEEICRQGGFFAGEACPFWAVACERDRSGQVLEASDEENDRQVQYTYDANGNRLTESRFEDPCHDSDCSEYRWEYDEQGFRVSEEYDHPGRLDWRYCRIDPPCPPPFQRCSSVNCETEFGDSTQYDNEPLHYDTEPPPNGPTPHQNWVVVVGSFSQTGPDGFDRANERAATLRAIGFTRTTVLNPSQTPAMTCCYWRVGAGWFQTRDAAVELLDEIEQQDFEGWVGPAFDE